MKPFTDTSTAPRTEKALRFLRSLASGHDYKYFFGDGFPRHAELQQDAVAALEVVEEMARVRRAVVSPQGTDEES